MIVRTIIDNARSLLHDRADDDTPTWTDDELLRWLNDGYRDLLVGSHAVVRPYQFDLPGRAAWSGVQEWEDRHAPGTYRRFTTPCATLHAQVCFLWEVEQLANISPTNSNACVSQLWERTALDADEIDDHFRFALSKTHERPLRAYWDGKRLLSVSTKEQDIRNTEWWKEGGEPFYWSQGVGREQSFEVFEVVTDYHQSYFLQGLDNGIPRHFSSDTDERIYGVETDPTAWDYGYTNGGDGGAGTPATGLGVRITYQATTALDTFGIHLWEKELTDGTAVEAETDSVDAGIGTQQWETPYWTLGIGGIRGLASSERQYVACAYDAGDQLVGSARYFGSGDQAITVWETIVPNRDLTVEDTPALIPSQLHKYLKFYVLSRAFGRTGQGYRPDLAQHYAALYQLGVGTLAALGTPSLRDRVYAREQVQEASVHAPPRVRFPSTFPSSR